MHHFTGEELVWEATLGSQLVHNARLAVLPVDPDSSGFPVRRVHIQPIERTYRGQQCPTGLLA